MIGKKPDVTVTATEHSVAAGRDITDSTITINARDPLDRQLIESLLADKARLLSENSQLREQVADAVTGLSSLDSEPSTIDQIREALARGDAEQAKALYQADAQRKISEGEDRLQEAASSYRRLGALAYLNDTADALSAYQRATELDPANPDAWNQLGHLYFRVGELTKSESAYKRLLTLAPSTDNQDMLCAIAYGNLGNVYQTRGELDHAVEMYEKSLAIERALDLHGGMATDYGNLGSVYQTRGQLDRAVEMYQISLAIDEALDHQEGMPRTTAISASSIRRGVS